MPRIAFIGAGSTVFTRNLVGDLLGHPELAGSTFALMDVDPDRLETSRTAVERLVAAHRAEAEVEATLDRREALAGARYVVTSFQVGGLEATLVDFEVPDQRQRVQGLAVEAALTGSRDAARRAAMLDPHTAAELPLDEISALMDALIDAHGERIPPCDDTMVGMDYLPATDRYERSPYRRCGRSGIQLPAISLGLWNNFGDDKPLETQRAMLRRAFDRGICHFDLANNYGPPAGSAEVNFGRVLREDLAPWRDELIISTKAGYDMWPGPYGEWGSRKYLLSSLDQSLQRMGLDYVDIFYSHRLDPDTPLEETLGALDTAVRQGKALYAGISSYSGERTLEAARILNDLGTPLLIHQPSYSMLNRWIEGDLLGVLEEEGVGCIAFSPLAQGMLTTRYLDGVPSDSRAAKGVFLSEDMLTEERLGHVRALDDIASRRGQTLAQMAVAWVLRDPRVTSALVGASSVEQLDDTLGALDNLEFSDDELREIDEHAVDAGINLWEPSSRA